MATASVTGKVRDFLELPMGAYKVSVAFIPSGPGISTSEGGMIHATRTIKASVTLDTGYFAADLSITDEMSPEVWYTIRVEWLDSAGQYTSLDVPDWKIRVPVGGGNIFQLVDTPATTNSVWVGETNNLAYRFWFKPSTNDLWMNS